MMYTLHLKIEKLEIFLRKVNDTFPVPLSEKQDLHLFAEKLIDKATLCAETENGDILSLVAGYTDQVVNGLAYISVVATLPNVRGKGYAQTLVKKFVSIVKDKGLSAVHLYTVETNMAAVTMYRNLGFEDYILSDEPRPDDLHLIYYIK